MAITEELIRDTLKKVSYPGFSRDIVSFGLVKSIRIEGNDVFINIGLATKDPSVPELVFKQAHEALESLEGIGSIKVDLDIQDPPTGQMAGSNTAQGQPEKATIPGVKRIIAVGSGKGGVGKSTVAANLAVGLNKQGLKVGLCDCDLYGPSVAHMFGSDDSPRANKNEEIIPIEAHGIKLMSMGFLLSDNAPVIVRGPIATRYTQQFLRNVAWGELDVLILDLPPGTGDIQLTIVQTIALDGAVIVTTPQEVALIDARKAVSMFDKVNVPVLGIIENMAYFLCPSDGETYHIFGEGGGAREAEKLNIPLLAQVPITIPTRTGGDEGSPVAITDSEDPAAKALLSVAAQLTQLPAFNTEDS